MSRAAFQGLRGKTRFATSRKWSPSLSSIAVRELSKKDTRFSGISPLREKWPLLQEAFYQAQNEHGEFPLFPKTQKNSKFTTKNNDPKQAAVLVLLCSVNNEPSILFTKRSGDLTQHAAEISFPGGHTEPRDQGNLVETALRESEEELMPLLSPNLLRDKVDIVGTTTPLPSLRGTPVTPVLGVLWHELADADGNGLAVTRVFAGDKREVDAVFTVTIAELAKSETTRPLPPNRLGITHGPVYRPPVVVKRYQGEIWGLTAYILRPLMQKLLKPIFLQSSFSSE